MRPGADNGAELRLSSGSRRHPIYKCMGGGGLQLIAPVTKSFRHNLKFPHCTFSVPSLTVSGGLDTALVKAYDR